MQFGGGGKKIGERDSMARLTRKNSFLRVYYYSYASERDENAPIAGFFHFSIGQFLFLLLSTRYPGKRNFFKTHKCVFYEEKGNSRIIFFLVKVIF